MLKTTDLTAVKAMAITFLNFEPEPIDNPVVAGLGYINHPFFESSIIPTLKIVNGKQEYGFADIFKDTEEYEKAKDRIKKEIMNGNLGTIFARLVKKYRLTFLKFIKPYMNKNDFEKILIEQWIMSENPNQDNNITIDEFIQWFKASDRKNLMNKEELEYYKALPDTVKIYRGVAVGRAEQQGLSWTCNYETAKWFSQRFDRADEKGYIIKGEIAKKDIFAYLNDRDEDEILCNSNKVFNKEIIREE